MSQNSSALERFLARLVLERDCLRMARSADLVNPPAEVVERDATGEPYGIRTEPGQIEQFLNHPSPVSGLLSEALAEAARANIYAVVAPLLIAANAAHQALKDAAEGGNWSVAFVQHAEALTALMPHRDAAEGVVEPPGQPTVLDACAWGMSLLTTTHLKGERITVTKLAKTIGVTRAQLYDNPEYEGVRKLGNTLFGLFETQAKKGDWSGPQGSKYKRNLEATDDED